MTGWEWTPTDTSDVPSLAQATGRGIPPTLTEFLLARIAEDEAVARDIHHRDCRIYIQLTVADCSCDMTARVLAECEAKRRIVELHSGDNDERCQSWNGNYVEEPCETLRALALPYADHESYDESWRP